VGGAPDDDTDDSSRLAVLAVPRPPPHQPQSARTLPTFKSATAQSCWNSKGAIMSIPGHSPKLVEVWNPEQKSFYLAHLVDIDEGTCLSLLSQLFVSFSCSKPFTATGMGVIQFIGAPDSQKIPLNHLRPCQPSITDASMQYSDRESVEVTCCSGRLEVCL
jgi:hypothetical protein